MLRHPIALTVLAAIALHTAPAAEVTGTFLGWSGGTGLAVHLIEVDHVTKRFMWIREKNAK